jgi:hypothetical protein
MTPFTCRASCEQIERGANHSQKINPPATAFEITFMSSLHSDQPVSASGSYHVFAIAKTWKRERSDCSDRCVSLRFEERERRAGLVHSELGAP